MDSNNFDRLSGKLANASSRRQALKLIAGGLAGGVLAAKGSSIAAQRPTFDNGIDLPTVDVVNEETGAVLEGVVTPTSFVTDGEVLSVVGNLIDSLGGVISGFTALVDLADPATTATCDILSLVLGPLELDVLGLVVEIPEPVILNIFAESGPGNLLGNLLCAVAGLLDGGGPLQGITGLLNNILRQLGLA